MIRTLRELALIIIQHNADVARLQHLIEIQRLNRRLVARFHGLVNLLHRLEKLDVVCSIILLLVFELGIVSGFAALRWHE